MYISSKNTLRNTQTIDQSSNKNTAKHHTKTLAQKKNAKNEPLPKKAMTEESMPLKRLAGSSGVILTGEFTNTTILCTLRRNKESNPKLSMLPPSDEQKVKIMDIELIM